MGRDLIDIKHHRMVHTLDWCARAYDTGRMPASVWSDIMCTIMLEATQTRGLWPMVCATMMARGHAMFADMLRTEAHHAA